MRLVKSFIGLAIAAVAVVFVGRLLVGFAGGSPLLMGLNASEPRGGCPSTDNCVSSVATESPWQIGHLVCAGDPDAVQDVFTRAILKMERIEQVDEYSFVASSRWLQFPDDVLIEPSARGLEIASSSRLGAGDLGVNRRRVEDLAAAVSRDPVCLSG